ncbi:MAG: histidine kinase [Nitrosarchaeum sp.]|nr:histidine kinase [Nitrosarchaeum sp.]
MEQQPIKKIKKNEFAAITSDELNNLEQQNEKLKLEKEGYQKIVVSLEKKLASKSREDEQLRILIHQMEKELQKKTEELLKAERLSAIGELAARLAHDIKNPLNTIKFAFELIQHNPKGNTNFEKQTGIVERAISRISHQIDDVLTFVKEGSPEFEDASLLDILRICAKKIKKSDKIIINLPTKDVHLVCDPYLLEVVFDNLLFNSVQAIAEKGKVIFSISDNKDENVIIEIQDTGAGISEDDLPKIFDPLFTTKQNGTGLGLASCKSIVEAHRGTITVKTNPTRFFVKLPKLQSKANYNSGCELR